MEENNEKSEKEKDLLKEDKSRAKIMLEELKLKYQIFNNTNLNEDNIIDKIIKLNFDEDKIRDYFDVDKVYQELEHYYNITAFTEKKIVNDIIVKFNFDMNRIMDWMDSKMLFG